MLEIRVNIIDSDLIKPCPFCNSSQLELSNTHTPTCTVRCDECGAEVGGEYFTENKSKKGQYYDIDDVINAIRSAIEKWNRRAIPEMKERGSE